MIFCLCHENKPTPVNRLKTDKAKGGLHELPTFFFSFLQYLLNAKKRNLGDDIISSLLLSLPVFEIAFFLNFLLFLFFFKKK